MTLLDETPPAAILSENRGGSAMPSHEYRVVPAPRRGLKVRGARRPEDRFARTIESEMNRMAAEGWEFVRSDTLPRDHKAGWFSRPVTVFETLLVFRREVAEAKADAPAMPPLMAAPDIPGPAVPAPAAKRFTPPPLAPLPANDGTLAAPPPTLTVVPDPLPEPPAEPASNPRLAAE